MLAYLVGIFLSFTMREVLHMVDLTGVWIHYRYTTTISSNNAYITPKNKVAVLYQYLLELSHI